MSREFGEAVGGFFHDKLRYAVEDAEGGKSPYTKVIGEVLVPLAEMAWQVSSVEAGDASEEAVISSILQHLPGLKRAVQHLEYAVQAHRNLADAAAYRAVRKFLPTPRWENQEKKVVAIDVPTDQDEKPLHVEEEQERLLLMHIHDFAQDTRLCLSSKSSSGGGRFWTWYYSPWNESGLLRQENQRLREQLSKAVLAVQPGQQCQYAGCEQPATCLAQGRDCGDGRGHPQVGVYCSTHAPMVADEGDPEYGEHCPNCGCQFGVN